MRKLHLATLLAVLFTAACAAGPDHHPPATPPSAARPFVTQGQGIDPAAPLPDDWWRLYRDPVLDGLIAQAFAANTDLRVAAANLARARAVLSETRAARLPATGLSAGGGYGNTVSLGGGQGGTAQIGEAQGFGNASASLSWEVDLFGRIHRMVEAARADAQAQAAARDGVRVMVAAEVTRAYLAACAQRHALDVARESADVAARSRDLVSARERAGSAAPLDVERAAAAAATARAALAPFEAQHGIALFELAALLGRTPDAIPPAAQGCSIPPPPASVLPVGDGAALLRRRPDLREAERRLAADTARIGVATADLYPRVSLGGFGGFLRSETVRGSDSFSFSLGPALSWSFPNIAVARARVKQARAQGEADLARFDGQVLTALKEVEQALSRVAAGQRQLDDLDEAQARAERAWQLGERRYRAGSISLLDMLVLQGALLDARAAHAAALAQLSSDRVDLFKALGGGWRGDALSAR